VRKTCIAQDNENPINRLDRHLRI